MVTQALPLNLALVVHQGATWRKHLRWTTTPDQIDLSAWTGRMQVRRFAGAPAVLADLTTGNGGITLGADGSIDLLLTAEQTADMPPIRGVYSLQLYAPAGGDVTEFMAGSCEVRRAVIAEVPAP